MSLRGTNAAGWGSELALREGQFLEVALPVRAFATLTSPWPMPERLITERFRRWAQVVQQHERLTLGWIESTELHPQPHIHAVLVAASALDCSRAALLWQQLVAPRYSEAARVEPYRGGLCGLGYILKMLGTPAEQVRFSDNLAAFAPSQTPHFPTNASQRRQRRRIATQIQAKGSNG